METPARSATSLIVGRSLTGETIGRPVSAARTSCAGSLEEPAARARAELPHPPRVPNALELDHLAVLEPGRRPAALEGDLQDAGLLERSPKRRSGRCAIPDLDPTGPFAGDPLAEGLNHVAAVVLPAREERSPPAPDPLDLLFGGKRRREPRRRLPDRRSRSRRRSSSRPQAV